MKRFRTLDIMAVLANRGLNHSDYDFNRLVLYLTGTYNYNTSDLKIAQGHLIQQFPEISKTIEEMIWDYENLKRIRNLSYDEYTSPFRVAEQKLLNEHGEWINIESPYGDSFYKEPHPSFSNPIMVTEGRDTYYIYPQVIQFPKRG